MKRVWKIIIAFVLLVSLFPFAPSLQASAASLWTLPDGDYSIDSDWYRLKNGENVLSDATSLVGKTGTLSVKDGQSQITLTGVNEIVSKIEVNGASAEIKDGKATFSIADITQTATVNVTYKPNPTFEHKLDYTVNFTDYPVATSWYYDGAVWPNISRFLNTTATVDVSDGKKLVTISDVSPIINDFKVNGTSNDISDGKATFEVDSTFSDVEVTISYSIGDRTNTHDFLVKFTDTPVPPVEESQPDDEEKEETPETEKPVEQPQPEEDKEEVTKPETEQPETETPGEKAIPTENAVKVDYEFKSDMEFIQNYLSPYFEKPATIVTEKDGKKYVYVTITGKMYGANVIQVVKEDGTKEDVEFYSSKGEGMDQVRVIKFPLNGDSTKLYVDSGSYGNYTVELAYIFDKEKEEEAPKYEAQILTKNGITLSGNLLKGVSLIVADEVSKEAKKAFEQVAGDGKILDLFDISLSAENGFEGDLVLTFNVDAEDGTVLYVLHYYDGKVEKHEATVVNGQISITVKHLSPFAVVSPADEEEINAETGSGSGSESGSGTETGNGAGTDAGNKVSNPETGDQANIALYVLLLIGSMFLLIRKYRTKTL